MKKYCLILLAGSIAITACTADDNIGGYLFVTFRGEGTPMTEQVYFLASENGRDWNALNNAEPVLVSTVGEKGVRDPYIIRSHDDNTFYLIATDLSIHLNPDWGRAQTNASQSLVVWESEDLVNWSDPRLVKVAPETAGNAWAPEAFYDEENDRYMVFWASKTSDDNFAKQRIWAAHTKDFKEFSEPFVYIDKPHTVIDTTIVKEEGVYYRFNKDEAKKNITMERSEDLMSGWTPVDGFSLSALQGYEGPTAFITEPSEEGQPAQWNLLLDFYSRGEGYQEFQTTDLKSGDFEGGNNMAFPFHPARHGSVLTLTKSEYDRIQTAEENNAFTVGR